MSQPKITVVKRNQANAGASSSDIVALCGVASAGPINQAVSLASTTQLQATFQDGPLVDAAALVIAKGKQVLVVRVSEAAPGDVVGSLNDASAGTSAITVSGTPAPRNFGQLIFKVIKGGTVGTAGITYGVSTDNGASFGDPIALGTNNSATIAPGVTLALGAGTLLAGDTASLRVDAPGYTATQLTAALNVLGDNRTKWDILHIVGESDAAMAAAASTKFSALADNVKPRMYVLNTRLPNDGESPATFLSAVSTAFGSFSDERAMVVLGGAMITSPISGAQKFSPSAYAVAAELGSAEPHIDIADTTRGALDGVSLTDINGNPLDYCYDESRTPGGDDAGFTTLRSWGNLDGFYVNNPRLKVSSGTTRFAQHIRVANIAHVVAYTFFQTVLSKPLRVDAKTGFLVPEVKKGLEKGATNALTTSLLAVPYLSGLSVSIDNTVDLTPETAEMQVNIDLSPLAYPKSIRLSMGFLNPQTVRV